MRAAFPATVHLFFIRENRILMLRRFNTGYRDGEYSVPAGHLDGGETVLAAAAREAREETGAQIETQHIAFAGVMHRREGDERIDFFVRVHSWRGEPFNAEPDKCDDLRWVDIGALPENTVPYIRRAIRNLAGGIMFDEYGWSNPK
jgi:8-oxo-dGTP diphosphatase